MIKFFRRLFFHKRHEHVYEIPICVNGYKFMKCSHPNCNVCDPVEDPAETERTRKLIERANQLLTT